MREGPRKAFGLRLCFRVGIRYTYGPMSLENVRIVLVSPIYGGNIGSVCRAMKNMGLSDLAIAAPRKDMDFAAAQTMATHANDVLDHRVEYPTLAEAVGGCSLVAGTTVREGLYREHSRTPREWAPRLLKEARKSRVALVFGPEDNGLSNEDLALCTQIMRIPSTDEYSSLNISHAVMVCCYELFLASGKYEGAVEGSPEAASAMREIMFSQWREALLGIGFMKEDKADHMMLGLRRILSRGKLTENDVRIMIGIAHQTLWVVDQLKKRKKHD